MEQCTTAQNTLVSLPMGQWPPTPVVTAMSWRERRTGRVWHGQELSHSVDVRIFIFGHGNIN